MVKEKVVYGSLPLVGQDMRAGTGGTRGGQGDERDDNEKVAPPRNQATCLSFLLVLVSGRHAIPPVNKRLKDVDMRK